MLFCDPQAPSLPCFYLTVIHELEYLGSQMKQSVIQGIKHSLKSLASLKKHNHTVVKPLP